RALFQILVPRLIHVLAMLPLTCQHPVELAALELAAVDFFQRRNPAVVEEAAAPRWWRAVATRPTTGIMVRMSAWPPPEITLPAGRTEAAGHAMAVCRWLNAGALRCQPRLLGLEPGDNLEIPTHFSFPERGTT